MQDKCGSVNACCQWQSCKKPFAHLVDSLALRLAIFLLYLPFESVHGSAGRRLMIACKILSLLASQFTCQKQVRTCLVMTAWATGRTLKTSDANRQVCRKSCFCAEVESLYLQALTPQQKDAAWKCQFPDKENQQHLQAPSTSIHKVSCIGIANELNSWIFGCQNCC